MKEITLTLKFGIIRWHHNRWGTFVKVFDADGNHIDSISGDKIFSTREEAVSGSIAQAPTSYFGSESRWMRIKARAVTATHKGELK